MEDTYHSTLPHGFLTSHDKELFDPFREFLAKEKFKSPFPLEKLEAGCRNYFGVHIPTPIMLKVYLREEAQQIYENIGGFLHNEIFIDDNETKKFIKEIQAASR